MDTKELLKKVRKIEIKTRRLSDHLFREYHTSFKGRGMTFSGANIHMEMTFVLLTGIVTA
jgi:hypothetical protein